MAVLTTLNITEKNDNNSLSVTVKVNITKKGVVTTTLSKEDVDKIRSYGIKLPTNRLGNEGYFNSTSFSDLVSQIRKVLKRCLSYKIVEEVPVIKYQLETLCSFAYDKNGNIVPNPSVEWTGNYENGEWRDGTSRLDALNAEPFGFSIYAKPFLKDGLCVEIEAHVCPVTRFFELPEIIGNDMIDEYTYRTNCI